MRKGLNIEEKEAIESILQDDGWKVIVSYIDKRMRLDINRELLDARPEDNLVYLKGKVDGAKALAFMLRDFKKYFLARKKD